MNPRSLVLGALALVAACTRSSPTQSVGATEIDVTGGTTITYSGLRIEVADSVRYVLHSVSATPGGVSREASLNGHPFGLRDGAFFIGDATFGPAPAGALVRVSGEGVFVNGERRGDVPAPVGGSGG